MPVGTVSVPKLVFLSNRRAEVGILRQPPLILNQKSRSIFLNLDFLWEKSGFGVILRQIRFFGEISQTDSKCSPDLIPKKRNHDKKSRLLRSLAGKDKLAVWRGRSDRLPQLKALTFTRISQKKTKYGTPRQSMGQGRQTFELPAPRSHDKMSYGSKEDCQGQE